VHLLVKKVLYKTITTKGVSNDRVLLTKETKGVMKIETIEVVDLLSDIEMTVDEMTIAAEMTVVAMTGTVDMKAEGVMIITEIEKEKEIGLIVTKTKTKTKTKRKSELIEIVKVTTVRIVTVTMKGELTVNYYFPSFGDST